VDLGTYRRLPFFLWQQTVALRRLKADWYLSNFFLPPSMPCKGVVAVHDLSFRAHPEYFPRTVAWYMRWLTALAIRQAELVVTGSEFSRQEIFRFHTVPEGKVAMLPYGAGTEFQPIEENGVDGPVLAHYGISGPYILALGNIHPRKNLARLLDAHMRLSRRRGDAPTLVWAGVQRWDSGKLVEQARSAGVILPGFVAQEHLPALYRQAVMLVYPSLYEGFGLPVVEAMACGTPVITSNTTSLPEVAGEAALQVDPTEVEAMVDAMDQLLGDALLRKRLRQAGLARVKELTWTRTAQHLLTLLGE
jgi:glycosyltransferase involved in cell wall biosynthesis